MRFVIRTIGVPFPDDMPLGPRGRELGAYIPAGIEWRQLNYGQGEGQVEIAGCEWGFYWESREEFALVLHTGEVTVAAGLALARGVAEVVCGSERFELVLRGTAEEAPPNNPPMQRTGAAGMVSVVRKLLGRGPGR